MSLFLAVLSDRREEPISRSAFSSVAVAAAAASTAAVYRSIGNKCLLAFQLKGLAHN